MTRKAMGTETVAARTGSTRKVLARTVAAALALTGVAVAPVTVPTAAADDLTCAAATNILINAFAGANDSDSVQMVDVLLTSFRGYRTPLLLQHGTQEATDAAIAGRGRAFAEAGDRAAINTAARGCIGNPALFSATQIQAAIDRLPADPYQRAGLCTAYIARDSDAEGVSSGGSGPHLTPKMVTAGNAWLRQAIEVGAQRNRAEAAVRQEILQARETLLAAPRDNWRAGALACLVTAPGATVTLGSASPAAAS